MSRTIRAGEQGVDFSFAKPPPARLVELGYTFVVGYISVPPSSSAKNITKAECDAYLAAGLAVLLVWEMSASRANLGAMYGMADGANARVQAAARGYPTDVPILAADDTNTTVANISAQEAYMRAFAAAAAPYPIGIYGDIDILGRCTGLWQIGWLPNAWAWSGSSRVGAEAKARDLGAHVLQRTGFYIDGVWAVDPNEVIADFPAWSLIPDPQPAPEANMILTNKETRNGLAPGTYKFGFDEITKRQMGAEYGELAAAGAIGAGIPLSNVALDAIPNYTAGGIPAGTPVHIDLTGVGTGTVG